LFVVAGAVTVFNLLGASSASSSGTLGDDSTGKSKKSVVGVSAEKSLREQQVCVRPCFQQVCICCGGRGVSWRVAVS
jgi:hypothetical protein